MNAAKLSQRQQSATVLIAAKRAVYPMASSHFRAKINEVACPRYVASTVAARCMQRKITRFDFGLRYAFFYLFTYSSARRSPY